MGVQEYGRLRSLVHRKHVSRISLFVVALAVAAGFSTAMLGQQTPGDAARGKDYFTKYTCYGCHGFSAQNGPGRNRLNPMTFTLAGFIGAVRAPGNTQMPTYSAKVISDQQLADIWTYVKTLPNAPDAKDIPLLQQIKQEASK
jgi:mono/diheme cytochrome c family protein